jgi:hypothetical protein
MFPSGGNDKEAEREPGPLIGSCGIARRNYGQEFWWKREMIPTMPFNSTISKIG